jgi:glucose-1-phosphate cytidylyltransferase
VTRETQNGKTTVAILAGGRGNRLSEITRSIPKPLINIGDRPILWHIMMYYATFGFNDFAIALGYRSEDVRVWFDEYSSSDAVNGWHVDLRETGSETKTGGRIKRLSRAVGKGTFMLTWCDGLSDVDLNDLLSFHRSHGKLVTLTAVRPPYRHGYLKLDGDQVTGISEEPLDQSRWINGAFFACEPGVFDYIDSDQTRFEREPMENLARDGELMAYRHGGFWECMDTLHDRGVLEQIWSSGRAPWAIWR